MPDLNQLPALAQVRHPRAAVKLNGTVVAGWVEWETDNNSFRAADTFRVEFAVSMLPAARNAAWIAAQTDIMVEIFAATNPADPDNYAPTAADRLIVGQVDDVSFEPALGKIELTGRDLTARLIDTKVSLNNTNQTSSQIVSAIAGKHGLTAVVTSTSTRVGTFYATDHVDVQQELSEWDLVAKLADYEGFDVFVTGTELHFGPKPVEGGDHYAVVWTPPSDDTAHPNLNATTLTLGRSLTIAKGVSVVVRSWNSKHKKAFIVTWPKSVKPTSPGKSGSGSLVYHITVPGKTQDEITQIAQQRYKQITDHMVTLSADLPGDAILDCGKTLALRGTGTSFDQVYYPDSVKRSMSVDEGYRMTVTAKNISQDIEAAAQ